MAQPGMPPQTPAGPWSAPGQYPPPYYPGYYPPPPPKSSNVAIIIVVVFIIVIVGTIVMAAILYVMVSGLLTGPPDGGLPVVMFSPPTLQGDVATLRVTSASSSISFDVYFVNLGVNGTRGTPTHVAPSFPIAVGGETYVVVFDDRNGNGLLDPNDEFRIIAPTGWRAGATYQFDLLWADLTALTSLSWSG